MLAERLRPLFKHDIALAAYHLPLDAHPEHGNNALLAEALGCDAPRARSPASAASGRSPATASRSTSCSRAWSAACGRTPLHQGAGPERVRRIGIVSGSAAGSLAAAADAGCDAFLTGEPKEHVMGEATERGIHFIAAGHYATETFGVRRLGELLERELGVEHVFVDLPEPRMNEVYLRHVEQSTLRTSADRDTVPLPRGKPHERRRNDGDSPDAHGAGPRGGTRAP